MKVIDKFVDDNRFLSNFFPASIMFEDILYPSVEHAYQAAKTLNKNDREKIASTKSPGKAKSIGKSLTLRKDWESIKLSVMENLVREKFTRHPGLGLLLKQTGDAELIEGNYWKDYFWGVCDGKGRNELGKILMKVRSGLNETETK